MELSRDANLGSETSRLADGNPLPPTHDLYPSRLSTSFLAALYDEHSNRLRRYFRGRGSPSNAEDLVQETFVRLAGAISRRPNTIEQPRAYVNQIANNLLREQARFAARRSAALHINDEDVMLSGPDPVAQLEARDMLERLEAAMAKMKPATREIFMAHKIDGYTYSEIAGRTGRSVKSVEKHIAKAIFLVNRTMRCC
jgi:RNA polymerase sigma factor (sigma-70 family)